MARSLTDIRAEIERVTAERAAVFARQASGAGNTEDLRDMRVGLDARLRFLWEELREARLGTVRLVDLTPAEARALIRHNPRVVAA